MDNNEHNLELTHVDIVDSYSTLVNQKLLVPSDVSSGFIADRQFVLALMAPMIERIAVDEDWYLANNPDVRKAISQGFVTSGRDHYVWHGYYEHRLPYRIKVDEKWYVSVYPDVKDAIQHKHVNSAQAHFETSGYREGRLPYADFRLRILNPRPGPKANRSRILKKAG
jgi:hypothetical protein